MRNILLFITGTFFLLATATSPKNSNIGGIGGQAVFDSTAQRFKIKSLEINHYINAQSLQPGDLILEIDKVPIHKMNYSDVLSLVQGTVGTPMSIKVLRYNAIEKYFELKRIRVTLDMNPTWWSVPDYRYFSFLEGINYTISQLKLNGKNSIDTIKIPNVSDKVYCNFSIRGAYESTYSRNAKGRYSWNCGFVKTDDKAKADGMYNYLVIQLRNYSLKNAKLIKTETLQPDAKTYSIKTNEVSDISLLNLNMDVRLKKEFDKAENKDLWKVEVEVRI
ncbi:MAG: PDZ domain-containing protein [Chitinophagales bacterium]